MRIFDWVIERFFRFVIWVIRRLILPRDINRLLDGSRSPDTSRPSPRPSPFASRPSAAAGQASPPRSGRPAKPVDPGRYKPLDRNVLVARAKVGRFFLGMPFNIWWGRRDAVPPSTDSRTELIDRAMVGQGFITPEELARLHTIGDEMLRLNPDRDSGAFVAEEAVTADRAARAAIKAQKKQEAADRKERHRQAVAHRRAIDIVFLGRGVSKGLADRRAHVEKLSAAGLPVLATPAELASALGVTIPRLRWLAFHHPASRTTHYTNFQVPKKSGGMRTLSSPKAGIRQCQSWILEHILSKVPAAEPAHGFVSKRGILTNAQPHSAALVLVNTDLSDFFPSITFWRVEGIFRELGYSPAVSTILALLCTESPRREVEYDKATLFVATGERSLPQGACTSPALSNLAARRLDSRLSGLARKLGWTYTRYADDATFSSRDPDSGRQVGYVLARIRHLCQDEGFIVNEVKTRVLRKNTRQSVTGITVNATTTLPRDLRRRVRAILHNARKTGLDAQNRDNHPNFRAWLSGTIAHIRMVHPTEGESFRTQLEALPRPGAP